jgi:hypothetical protein
MNLFGFEIRRQQELEQQNNPNIQTFAPEVEDDGALVVAAGGAYGTYVDLQGTARSEAELITKYRDVAQHPEVDSAVDDIVNEAINVNETEKIVEIVLDDVKGASDATKKLITQEFDNILELLSFNQQAYEIFKRFYIDGRLYYHMVVDNGNLKEGIQELRYLDPRKIRKVKEVKQRKDPKTQATLQKKAGEYYIYQEKGFNQATVGAAAGATQAAGGYGTQSLRIAKDSIVHVTSGLMDVNNRVVLSYLHKAIKPLNQLRTLEDATVIYRVSRAPERRIFYIDVGNLPKMKAEQYLRDMMVRHKNKIVYDSSNGEIRDDRKFMTMLEDYWFPRREGGKGTEVTTLPAGQNLGEMTDVEYFQKKLYQSLNVPVTRMQSDNTFSLGKSSEITRDEIKFNKFIQRLRNRFTQLFLKSLERQLILKGVATSEDWAQISGKVRFNFAIDNYFAELKESEIMQGRVQLLQQIDPYVGKYYSTEWIRKNVLRQSDEDIEEIDSQMDEDSANPSLNPPADIINPGGAQGTPNSPDINK